MMINFDFGYYAKIFDNRFNPSSLLKVISIIIPLTFFLIIVSGTAYAQDMSNQSDIPPPHWPYHAILVSTGLIFMAAGVLTARSMKSRRWWLKTHKSLALFGVSLTITGFLIAAYLVITYRQTYLVMETHAYLGIVAILLVVSTPIIGFMQFKLRDKRLRAVHKWSGRAVLVFMLANVLAGLQMVLK